MTDTSCDDCCLKCYDSDNLPGLWLRRVPENIPIRGKLHLRVLKTPDMSERESAIGWKHYVHFKLGRQEAYTRNFETAKKIREDVITFDLDGRSHYLKIAAYTSTWLPCLPDLLNGTMEINVQEALEEQGVETQLYYKHRFHKLLPGTLRMEVWVKGEANEEKADYTVRGKLRENPQHPLEAWHRGAYDAIFDAWLTGRVDWVDNFFYDMGIYICNQHLLLGCFYAHHWNPLTHRARGVVFFVSLIMNVFALGLTYYAQRCQTPDCQTSDYTRDCLTSDADGYVKCNGGGTTYYCSDSVQTRSCKEISLEEEYGYLAVGALIAYLITRLLIFFGECKCAKYISRDSENAWFRKCLEDGGRFFIFIGVLVSVGLVVIGVLITLDHYNQTGQPDGWMWTYTFLLQVASAQIYDIIFCILFFVVFNCMSTYEPLVFMEDDDFFKMHPELEGIDYLSPASKRNKGKTIGDSQTAGHSPKHSYIGKNRDVEKAIEMDQKNPLGAKERRQNQKKQVSQPAIQRSLANMLGDEQDSTAARPKKISFQKEEKKTTSQMKKMRVKIPANAKPGGLLKVTTPEKLSILIRVPKDVVPGQSEMIVDYVVRK
mmetsp:Transcript_20831/g.37112  ORF Transcript_20831/g.37112 Transcript_20831/m.37112 type:complete len:600 (+) Transcript_20831:122-1921(+)|eukprot:CAMPEP_0197538396 /NCGR_PEP_ID=MMETSP1318-20131121/59621_1 /TAXON_ID=552666 /ORGANISM="Partenskyella glossopodia, Strain RCC365" /LENGTH=599 /DNA_ID=CAMNT_0043096795 /DNA_START=12 /DNA_END=1811 /DNA_ORIENTATION=+